MGFLTKPGALRLIKMNSQVSGEIIPMRMA